VASVCCLRPLGHRGVIEGNTFREILVGPVMVLLWACAVFLIDLWVLKVADRKETRTRLTPTELRTAVASRSMISLRI
jgi:hypothetical protein